MTNRGAEYSKIFRKAGLAWGKGKLHQALTLVQDGLALATERGDTDAVRIFQADVDRYQRALAGEDIDLSH